MAMNSGLTINQYLENLETNYFAGAFTRCWDTWRFDKTVPPYNKFYYIVEGECYIKIDNKEYIAKKGQLFLLPFNSVQTYYHISNNNVLKYWIHCTYTCNDKDLLEIITLPHFVTVDDPEYVENLFKQIISYDDADMIISKLIKKACLLQLLAYYFKKANVEKEKFFKDEKISLLMSYIETNLQNEITIGKLAGIMHFHPNYFIRFFKEMIGMPPIEYINNMRIEQAKKLLQTMDTPIREIACEVGFNTSYYFTRIFKKKIGFTPSGYRLMLRATLPEEEEEDNK